MSEEFKKDKAYLATASAFKTPGGQQYIVSAPDEAALKIALKYLLPKPEFILMTSRKFKKVKITNDEATNHG